MVKKHNLTFPVLMDKDNHYAEQLGLTFPLPEKLQQVYLGFGIDLERFSGNNSWVLPMCGRFIIDSTGIIRDAEVHLDHTTRPEPSEIVDIIKSIQ